MDKLIIPTLKSLVVGVLLLGLLLFLPAGTLNYWQAWVVIAIFVLGSNAIGIYLSVRDPERRKQAGPQAITFLVVKENSFSASTIKVFKDQKVISTGPYTLVRHPMYTGTLLLALASPLALGSWWGLLPVLLVIPVLVWRIFDEEKLLNAELPGYSDYANRVRYRLVPLGW
jgi:protein-S-isoprenylcysteine O-methyltransferase Ste14